MSNDIQFATSHAGIHMPYVIYGTAWKEARTAELVALALEQGFRGIDTACQPKHYNEQGVGVGLQIAYDRGIKREELYLQSKFTPLNGQDPARIPYDANAPLAEQVVQSCDRSLENLQTNYLDALVLHSPLPTEEQFVEVWQSMEGLQVKGLVKQLGISNCYHFDTFRWLYDQAKVKPAVLQNRFYRTSGFDKELRQFCREHGVIYQSFWTLTANQDLLGAHAVSSLTERYGKTSAQILFRFLTQTGAVPLTGTTSIAHMKDDLAIFTFRLEPSEIRDLERLL